MATISDLKNIDLHTQPTREAPTEKEPDCHETITNLFWLAISTFTALSQMATLPLYSLFDDGLGNLLGLEVLRHGTCFSNYVSILTHGADPSFGGKENGSTILVGTARELAATKNRFYAFKDSRAGGPFNKFIAIWGGPTIHATLSGYNHAADLKEGGCVVTIYRVANAIFNGLFTPTLRVKFTLEEVERIFEDDPDYQITPISAAYRTEQKVSTEHFGIMGSLRQGLNSDLLNRISQNPAKCLIGLIEVVAAVAFSTLLLEGLLLAAMYEAALMPIGYVSAILLSCCGNA
ncbi:MAG: hypothetical protein HYX48_01570 [Chlamydiales bacterium]|nr:hypothetical protein [Chlamydiales bacterium]